MVKVSTEVGEVAGTFTWLTKPRPWPASMSMAGDMRLPDKTFVWKQYLSCLEVAVRVAAVTAKVEVAV